MCTHPKYVGETASGDDVDLCPTCEKRRDWAEEDRQDYWDTLAELKRARHESIADGSDQW